VIRACATFDLIATGLLAWPPLARWFIGVLFTVNGFLGGVAEPPPFTALQWFFVTLAGALGVLWAIVRLLRPLRFLALADVIARAWVAGLIVYWVAHGAPRVLLLFVVSELAGSLAQLRAIR
jgi:hypothetical protein